MTVVAVTCFIIKKNAAEKSFESSTPPHIVETLYQNVKLILAYRWLAATEIRNLKQL